MAAPHTITYDSPTRTIKINGVTVYIFAAGLTSLIADQVGNLMVSVITGVFEVLQDGKLKNQP